MTMSPTRPSPPGALSITELLEELNGRLSYRILDYWIRTGTVTLAHPGRGSGSRRCVTPEERAAIYGLVEAYERAHADLEHLRSGALFAELMAWHRIDDDREAEIAS